MVGRTHLLTSGSRFLPGLTKGKGHTMTRETTTSTRTPKRARGTVSYEDQTISTRAIALLAGAQHASIDVHGAGQDGARLSLTWGTLLLGFTAADQVDALAEAFADSQSAAKRIPERLDPKILSAEIGDEAYLPAISVGFREVPRYEVSVQTLAPGRLDSWAHRRHCLHIRVGVILFRVSGRALRDHCGLRRLPARLPRCRDLADRRRGATTPRPTVPTPGEHRARTTHGHPTPG